MNYKTLPSLLRRKYSYISGTKSQSARWCQTFCTRQKTLVARIFGQRRTLARSLSCTFNKFTRSSFIYRVEIKHAADIPGVPDVSSRCCLQRRVKIRYRRAVVIERDGRSLHTVWVCKKGQRPLSPASAIRTLTLRRTPEEELDGCMLGIRSIRLGLINQTGRECDRGSDRQ